MTGNTPFKSFFRLPGGGETQRCYYPLKLDVYGRGCVHNCAYCYARSVLWFRKLWNPVSPAVADRGVVVKRMVRWLEGRGSAGYARERLPIRLGGMTDCFSEFERGHRVGLEMLRLLNRYRYPYLILTKGVLLAESEYLAELDPELAYVQWSYSTPFDDVAARIEARAPSPSKRLEAMEKVAKAGVVTAARINPLFPLYPDGHYTAGGSECGPLRVFDWSLVERCCDAGIKTLIGGFVRLSTWNIRWMKGAIGEDLTYLFDPSTKRRNTALHFGAAEKRYYYERCKEIANGAGVAFSVCYDGDDDYETFRYLWADQDDCCNGRLTVPAFGTTFGAFRD